MAKLEKTSEDLLDNYTSEDWSRDIQKALKKFGALRIPPKTDSQPTNEYEVKFVPNQKGKK